MVEYWQQHDYDTTNMLHIFFIVRLFCDILKNNTYFFVYETGSHWLTFTGGKEGKEGERYYGNLDRVTFSTTRDAWWASWRERRYKKVRMNSVEYRERGHSYFSFVITVVCHKSNRTFMFLLPGWTFYCYCSCFLDLINTFYLTMCVIHMVNLVYSFSCKVAFMVWISTFLLIIIKSFSY